MARKTRTVVDQMTEHADAGTASFRRAYADNWSNVWQGYGIQGRDKSTATRFEQRAMLTWQERTAIYRQNWIGKRIVDDLSADATRAGFNIGVTDNEELPEQIRQEWERLHMHDVLRMGMTWGLVYGGAVGLLLTDDTPIALSAPSQGISMQSEATIATGTITVLTTPMDLNTLRSLKRIVIVDARYALPDITSYTSDLDSPNFGKPEYYTVTPYGSTTNTTAYRVHWSRLVRFEGVPTDMLTRVANLTWGDSIYEGVYDVLSRYGIAYTGAALAAGEFTQGMLKMKGFNTLQASKQAQVLLNRINAFKMGLGAANLAVVDADSEDYERLGQPVGGLPEILDRLKEEVAGAVRIPQSRLWGNQAGKVAGAEQDRDLWADWVHGWQDYVLLPVLRRVTDLVLLGKDGPTGGKLVDYTITCNPIAPPDLDKDIARREKQAKIDQVYYGMNALEASEIRNSRFGGSAYSYETTLNPEITQSLEAVDLRAAEAAELAPEEAETEEPTALPGE